MKLIGQYSQYANGALDHSRFGTDDYLLRGTGTCLPSFE